MKNTLTKETITFYYEEAVEKNNALAEKAMIELYAIIEGITNAQAYHELRKALSENK